MIRLVVLMYVRFPPSLRHVEDLLFERGIDISHETVRFWWNRFGPIFAADTASLSMRSGPWVRDRLCALAVSRWFDRDRRQATLDRQPDPCTLDHPEAAP